MCSSMASFSFKLWILSALFCLSMAAVDRSLMDFYSDLLVKSRNSEVLHDSPIPLNRAETQMLSNLFLKRHKAAPEAAEVETDPKKRKVDRHSARVLNRLRSSRFHF